MILRNFLMNGVVFAVPGGAPSGAAAGDPPNKGDDNGGQADPPASGEAGDQGDSDTGDQDDATADDVDSEGGETDEGAAAPVGEQSGEPAAAPKEDWKDKELRRKHAQNQQTKRRLEEVERENADLRAIADRSGKKPDAAAGAGETAPAAGLTQEDVDRAAARQIAERDFNNEANKADQAGRKNYKDWDKATDTLKTLGGFDPETMQSLLATDDPAKVLHTLGSKPDEYHRVMDLPPAKRLAEMIKMALPAPKQKNPPSKAAAPVAPVGARTRQGGTDLRDDLSDDDWYARRRAQKEARWKQKTGQSA